MRIPLAEAVHPWVRWEGLVSRFESSPSAGGARGLESFFFQDTTMLWVFENRKGHVFQNPTYVGGFEAIWVAALGTLEKGPLGCGHSLHTVGFQSPRFELNL